ncbi:hypothetical protein [Plasmodium yoelii yoelii]|uniref:Uncharacterized protein n=1 Tax=Plasmodium yoelii yoelii TaxID=73239 RepID=Q7RH76_PLAYO|nr:hypothetical protein [Plasmodium yoelii yoelii]
MFKYAIRLKIKKEYVFFAKFNYKKINTKQNKFMVMFWEIKNIYI